MRIHRHVSENPGYKWQRGTVLPTVDNLAILAEIFEVHIDEILIIEDA